MEHQVRLVILGLLSILLLAITTYAFLKDLHGIIYGVLSLATNGLTGITTWSLSSKKHSDPS